MNYKTLSVALSLAILAGCGSRCCKKSCAPTCDEQQVCTTDVRTTAENTKVIRQSGPLSEKTVAWDEQDLGKVKKEKYTVA